jgi:hypothetical protein
MKPLSTIDVLEAAAHALVSERSRPSYLHDIRGELQALHAAVELLTRAAKSPQGNAVLAEKAAMLAKRAVLNHEKWLAEFLDELTPQHEAATRVNVGELLEEVLRFVRNDAVNKSVTFRCELARDIVVLAPAYKFRMLVLGLCSTLADGLAPGSVIDITVSRADPHALVEFRSPVPYSSIPSPEELWRPGGRPGSEFELLLSLTQRWSEENGGSLQLSRELNLPHALRLYYPMASANINIEV